MTFSNRLNLVRDAVYFKHSLRVDIKVKIVEDSDGKRHNSPDWSITFECRSKALVEGFRKELTQQIISYLVARTKTRPQDIIFVKIKELATARLIVGANTTDV